SGTSSLQSWWVPAPRVVAAELWFTLKTLSRLNLIPQPQPLRRLWRMRTRRHQITRRHPISRQGQIRRLWIPTEYLRVQLRNLRPAHHLRFSRSRLVSTPGSARYRRPAGRCVRRMVGPTPDWLSDKANV